MDAGLTRLIIASWPGYALVQVRSKVTGSPGAICAANGPIPRSSGAMKTLKRLPGFSSSLVRLPPVSLALAMLHDSYNAPS